MPPRNFRFRNAIADVPILNGAQFGQAALCAADDVLVHPTDTGCVGAESWRYAGGQSAGGRTPIFEDTRARPIKISAILEMRVFDRGLIRGEHYGQRSCEPLSKAEHTAASTQACDVKIL